MVSAATSFTVAFGMTMVMATTTAFTVAFGMTMVVATTTAFTVVFGVFVVMAITIASTIVTTTATTFTTQHIDITLYLFVSGIAQSNHSSLEMELLACQRIVKVNHNGLIFHFKH